MITNEWEMKAEENQERESDAGVGWGTMLEKEDSHPQNQFSLLVCLLVLVCLVWFVSGEGLFLSLFVCLLFCLFFCFCLVFCLFLWFYPGKNSYFRAIGIQCHLCSQPKNHGTKRQGSCFLPALYLGM